MTRGGAGGGGGWPRLFGFGGGGGVAGSSFSVNAIFRNRFCAHRRIAGDWTLERLQP